MSTTYDSQLADADARAALREMADLRAALSSAHETIRAMASSLRETLEIASRNEAGPYQGRARAALTLAKEMQR